MNSDADLASRRKTLLRRYSYAVAFVALSGTLRATLLPGKASATPFSFFYPAIILAALLGGAGPGVASTILSALVALLVTPSPPAPINWMVFIVLSPLFVVVFSRLKRLRDRGAAFSAEALKLRFVVDRASDWIILVSRDNEIEYMNQTARASLGYGPDELLGHKIEDLAVEAHRSPLIDLLGKCQHSAVPLAESVWKRRDGSSVPVEVSCSAISVQERQIVHIAARDITERKSIERKLREARQWQGLGSLAGGVAHDFNNLLTSIMGNASLARETLPAGHPVIGLVESIQAAGERSAELVRMMLAASGYKPRYIETIRLDDMLARVLLEHPLPSSIRVLTSAEAATVESDRRSMETLLWSLISNAAEAYAQGEGDVIVSIASVSSLSGNMSSPCPSGYELFEDGEAPSGPCAHISVEDHACGMPPEVLERAFDPFFSTRFTGRGLGLPAVRGIVRAHGGRLVLTTRPGAGAKVNVWLPAAGARYDMNESR